MRLALVLALVAAAGLAIALSVDMNAVARWAAEQQRGFQNQMAGAIRALRAGEPGAHVALLGAAGAYGFVHALGPGHGKYLIGGVGFGTSVPASRLLAIALASSLAQALWAIVLVYGGFSLLEASARRMTSFAEDILAPASYLAIAAVGLILVWRGVGSVLRRARTGADTASAHAQDECGCHAHGPSPEEAANARSLRDAAILVGSIAMRPCTGAVFLLVIAWQVEIRLAGAAAVVVMGLGTALLTSLVAVSSVAARGISWAAADRMSAMALALPAFQALAGILIVWMSLLLSGLGPF